MVGAEAEHFFPQAVTKSLASAHIGNPVLFRRMQRRQLQPHFLDFCLGRKSTVRNSLPPNPWPSDGLRERVGLASLEV